MKNEVGTANTKGQQRAMPPPTPVLHEADVCRWDILQEKEAVCLSSGQAFVSFTSQKQDILVLVGVPAVPSVSS